MRISRIAAGASKRSIRAPAAEAAAVRSGPDDAALLQPAMSAATPASAAARLLVVARHRLEEVRELDAGVGEPGRDVVAGHLVGLVAAQDPPRDRLAMDLVGPVVDPPRPSVAVHALERHVAGEAQRPVD